MNIFDFVKFSIKEEHKSINQLLDKLDNSLLATPIGDDDSIGKRLMHMTAAEYSMAIYVYQQEEDEKKEFPITIEGLRESFKRSEKRHLETIDALTENDLDKVYVSKVSGKEYSYTWLLYHFIEHLSTHRGQVATSLRLASQ
ncbi:MAG: DinB family protein [Candidatus Heimdallarchaeota archaeon]